MSHHSHTKIHANVLDWFQNGVGVYLRLWKLKVENHGIVHFFPFKAFNEPHGIFFVLSTLFNYLNFLIDIIPYVRTHTRFISAQDV